MAPRKRRDPRQDKTGKYPEGFSRFGTPTTCGILMPHGECPEPRRDGSGKCAYHLGLSSIDGQPKRREPSRADRSDAERRSKIMGMIDPTIQRDLTDHKPSWWGQ